MGMPTWLVLGQFALASRCPSADVLLGLAEALEDAARAPPADAGIAIGAVPASRRPRRRRRPCVAKRSPWPAACAAAPPGPPSR